ncbi:GMC oxidoreductase [Geosmithia morbida]|uniref:GMC oxidoreductase n=1 Tax=Geosmithia morbida TaxID=1094350 RepID=A0A9P5D2I3_9HYPO|nr:GMC oxidoreductase [Geosmithia morbida]KAF4120845.1 GMC oxidoreductase [Geosmithia morbida]
MELRKSKYDWPYKTTIIKRDDYERIEELDTRGKVLGGSKGTFDMWEGRQHLLEGARGSPIPISHSELIPEMQCFQGLLTEAWKSTGQSLRENISDGDTIGSDAQRQNHLQGLPFRQLPRCGRQVQHQLFCPRCTPRSSSSTIADKPPARESLLSLRRVRRLSLYANREVISSSALDRLASVFWITPGVPLALPVRGGYRMDDCILREGTGRHKRAVGAYQDDKHGGPMGYGFLEMVELARIGRYLEKGAILDRYQNKVW